MIGRSLAHYSIIEKLGEGGTRRQPRRSAAHRQAPGALQEPLVGCRGFSFSALLSVCALAISASLRLSVRSYSRRDLCKLP